MRGACGSGRWKLIREKCYPSRTRGSERRSATGLGSQPRGTVPYAGLCGQRGFAHLVFGLGGHHGAAGGRGHDAGTRAPEGVGPLRSDRGLNGDGARVGGA